MKKIALLLSLSMLLSLAACGGSNHAQNSESETVELTVFAAASLTETLNPLAETYQSAHEDVKLTFNFDSSGTLKTQIEEGAQCDLFLSAAQKQMNELEEAGLVATESRIDLLENQVVLSVPDADSENAVTSFDDMAQRLADGTILLAMGNEDVPVGQYTQKILSYYGLDEAELAAAGVLTYGSNVKEVTTQVKEASVDCGVIYCTDAFSAGLTVVDEALPEMCGQVIYPAAVLENSANAAAAQDFLDFLTTDEAMEVFASVGFCPVS